VLDEYLLTDDQDDVRAHWLAIIRRYPDRFVIGSDLVGQFRNIGSKLAEFDVMLRELSDEHARMVAHDNMLQVLPRQRLKAAQR
jgi:hypothetical protein